MSSEKVELVSITIHLYRPRTIGRIDEMDAEVTSSALCGEGGEGKTSTPVPCWTTIDCTTSPSMAAGSEGRSARVSFEARLRWTLTAPRSVLRSISSTGWLVSCRNRTARFTASVVVPTPPFSEKNVTTCARLGSSVCVGVAGRTIAGTR